MLLEAQSLTGSLSLGSMFLRAMLRIAPSGAARRNMSRSSSRWTLVASFKRGAWHEVLRVSAYEQWHEV